jgi:hypothetical protein
MARIRSIKPDFFMHDKIASLPCMVRLLFIGLWTQADRDGRLHDNPKRLKAHIFPYESFDVEKGLQTLFKSGFIIRYKSNADNSREPAIDPIASNKETEGYIQIVNWSKHQKIDKANEKESLIPEPNQIDYKKTIDSLLIAGEGKGKEGRGKEGRERAKPPSHEEVLNFSLSKNYPLHEVNKFYAHYAANGWVQGKAKATIKDWKAALVGWMLRSKDFKSEKTEQSTVYKAPKVENGQKY